VDITAGDDFLGL